MQTETKQLDINYPPNFQSTYGYTSPIATHINRLMQSKQETQLEFIDDIRSLRDELSQIPFDAPELAATARWNQPWFPALDGMSMYTIVAKRKPSRYIEIGSGNSTKFAAAAIVDHKLDTEIVSVDPHPREEVDGICDHVIRKRLEDATELHDYIAELGPNDIVFFDGSHRCFQNSDVTVFFIDYLPSIPEGVAVGVHDIFWPNDYPPSWVERYYNEQYILGAYMLGMGSQLPLIFACTYMAINHQEKLVECLDEKLIAEFQNCGRGVGGGAVWFQKKNL